MKIATLLLILLTVATAGCRVAPDEPVGERDYLIGWYNLPERNYSNRKAVQGPGTLIPVFKRAGVYYSTCRGVEVPLKVCPEGLEWGWTPSKMVGTKIGLDEASQKTYIIIEDRKAQENDDYSMSGEKQVMTKIEKPACVRDPTIKTPRTCDDMLGCYEPVYFPLIRLTLSKNGNQYCVQGKMATREGWEMIHKEPLELELLSGKLGFSSKKFKAVLVFNQDHKRVEYVNPDGVTMPLVRVKQALLPWMEEKPALVEIGIPSWN
jgi:hypothetical protein